MIEANVEEDIDSKNQCRVKNLPDPISIREAASKNYVDNKFDDPKKKTENNNPHLDIGLNDKKSYQCRINRSNSTAGNQ